MYGKGAKQTEVVIVVSSSLSLRRQAIEIRVSHKRLK